MSDSKDNQKSTSSLLKTAIRHFIRICDDQKDSIPLDDNLEALEIAWDTMKSAYLARDWKTLANIPEDLDYFLEDNLEWQGVVKMLQDAAAVDDKEHTLPDAIP